ncbi:MAG: M1 family aminopeptidase, partial [Bacteroidetes bacterium]|nr:M1 family aminopeptidase [Bacteroidota bacterium]
YNSDESLTETLSSWIVTQPINTYCIVPYIGNYINFTDTFVGEKGTLDLSYWVLDYNKEKAQEQFKQVKPMLKAFEYWFGAYPFYEDGYKLVEAPYLGMEHQSAIAYGNGFQNGYKGRDLSGSGWGLKWDFIIVHESGHEWFANSITTNDIADMWVHEGFTNYSEVLFTEYYYGKEAANDYCYGLRKNIANDIPIIGPYGVNKEGSGDMYYKASNMIHSIRNALNNDKKFRKILRGMNEKFYHKTIDGKDIEQYLIEQTGLDLQKTFDQYLTTIQIPTLEYYFKGKKLFYRYSNCIDGFNMPITIPSNNKTIIPTTSWQHKRLSNKNKEWFTDKNVERLYLLKMKNCENEKK